MDYHSGLARIFLVQRLKQQEGFPTSGNDSECPATCITRMNSNHPVVQITSPFIVFFKADGVKFLYK
jgi:hypothetical protein